MYTIKMHSSVLICSALLKTLLLYPLETLKTRLILHHCEFADAWENLFVHQGAQGVFSGLLPALAISTVASTLGTFTVNQVKHQLLPTKDLAKTKVPDIPIPPRHDPLPALIKSTPRIPDVFQTPIEIFSYGMSGILVAAVTCPLVVVQLALQLDSPIHMNAYAAVTSMIRQGGIGSLFVGYVPLLLHHLIYRASLCALFYSLDRYFSWLRTKSEKNMPRAFKEYMKRLGLSRSRTIDIIVSFLISGVFTSMISSPFAVVTTTLQCGLILGKKLTIGSVISNIYTTHGCVGFFSGLLPYAVQTSLAGITSFLFVKHFMSKKVNPEEPTTQQTLRDLVDDTWEMVSKKIRK